MTRKTVVAFICALTCLSLQAQLAFEETAVASPPPRAEEPLAGSDPLPEDVGAEGATTAAHLTPRSDAMPNGELNLDGPDDIQLKVFDGSIRLFTDSTASTAGVERMRIWPTTGNAIIGTLNAAQTQKLYVYSTAPGGAFYGMHSVSYPSNTTASELSGVSVMYSNVDSGVTKSGWSVGLKGGSFLKGTGTLETAVGLYSENGLKNIPEDTGTITNAYGIYSFVQQYNGSIQNGYGLFIPDVTATNDWGIVQVGTDDDNQFAGRVAIGTPLGTPPAQRLHVYENTDANTVALIENPHSGASVTGTLQLKSNTAGMSISSHGSGRTLQRFGKTLGGFNEILSFNGFGLIVGSNQDKPLILGTNNLSRIYVKGDGNVGIGTDAPVAKLDVNGSVKAAAMTVSGNITAGSINATTITGVTVFGAVYQDVAEWVPATTDMEPGTVVVLNLERNNEVMASHTAYDTSVAGVVSAQPGVLLGVAGADKEQIATTGRVKVRVDARQTPIRVGDLLVTSDVSGTAMRSEPMDINGRRFHQPGTIIGKALEPLEGGVGEILVLLSLQ